MFSKKNIPQQLELPGTVIGKGAILEAAKLSGKDSVRIDGLYKGTVDIDGNLLLGDTGNINGDIRARYIVLAGRVTGNIRCDSVLHLAATSIVEGNVETRSLVVDEGSKVYGTYKVGDLNDAPEPVAIEEKSSRASLYDYDIN